MSRNNEADDSSTDLRDSDVFAYCSDLPDADDGTAHAERDDVIHVLVSNSSEINKHWHDDVDSEALLTNIFYAVRGQAQLIANLRGVQFAECTVYLSFFDWNTRDFVAKFLRNSETVADYAVTSAEVRDFAETINHQSVKNAAEDHSEAVAGDLNTDGVTSTGNSLGAQINALADANPDLTDENEYPTDALEARIDLIKRGARDSFIEELCNNPYLEDGYHYDKAGDDITWDDMRSKGYPFTPDAAVVFNDKSGYDDSHGDLAALNGDPEVLAFIENTPNLVVENKELMHWNPDDEADADSNASPAPADD
jgi:hypothetical protein